MQQQEESTSFQSSWGVPAENTSQATEVSVGTFASRPLSLAEVNEANPLIYRLKRNSSVRHLAMATLRGEPLTTISPLLKPLNSPSEYGWKSRQVAAWTLGRAQLNSRQQEIAAETLVRVLEGRSDYDGAHLVRAVLGAVLAVSLLMMPLGIVFWQELWNAFPVFIGAAILVGVLCSSGNVSISLESEDEKTIRIRAAAAEALGNLRRPETVGTLLVAHLEGKKKVCAAATSALRQVLPTLTSDHYGQLESSVSPNLCRALTYWDTTFVLDVVTALGKVGDGRAATALEELEQSERRSEVRKEIAKILPILLERKRYELELKRREEESGTLLRGTANPLPTEELLRPAGIQSPDEAKETLLRATRGDE
jgi:HEAT repeat protein